MLSAHVAVGGALSLEDAQVTGAMVKEAIAQRLGTAHSTLELERADGAECARTRTGTPRANR